MKHIPSNDDRVHSFTVISQFTLANSFFIPILPIRLLAPSQTNENWVRKQECFPKTHLVESAGGCFDFRMFDEAQISIISLGIFGKSPVELDVFAHKNGLIVTFESFKYRFAAKLSRALRHVENRSPKLPTQKIIFHPLPLEIFIFHCHSAPKAHSVFHQRGNLFEKRFW